MCRNSFKKIRLVIILVAVIFSLFSNFKVIAVTDDDGPDVKDSSIIWHTTCFGGEDLGAINPNTRKCIWCK